jgi:hypothetical protein
MPYHRWGSTVLRHLGARRCLSTVCAMLLSHLCASRGILHAAPVTFRFEADVASVNPIGNGANLPFNLSAGDPIVASFTFEPSIGGPHFPQSGGLRFELAGQHVSTSTYTISVHDESVPNAAPISGSIADPLNTPVVDQAPGSSDNIFITCPAPQSSFCAVVSGYDQLSVRPSIALSTDFEVLSSNNLVADLHAWNSFTFREMSLVFHDSSTGGETYVGAYIGAVQSAAAPEPASILMAIMGAIALLIARRILARLRID